MTSRTSDSSDGQSVRIALVQYQMRGIGTFDAFAEQVEYFVRAAAGYAVDFVLLPEFTSLQLLSSAELRCQLAQAAIAQLARRTGDVLGLMSEWGRRYGVHLIGVSHPTPSREGGPSPLRNVCPIALPDGRVLMQPKLHITPWETTAWGLQGGAQLAIIPTPKAKIGVLVCYDSEFP